MKKEKNIFATLFSSMFQLSLFTFGGGYVIVPLMEKKFVKELGWITEDQMLDMIAISQSSPGPIAVHASLLVGYHVAKLKGAIIAGIGTVLPPFLIMTVISYIYLMIRDNPLVNNILLGMSAGVAAIIINVVYDMGKRIVSQKKIVPILVMVAALIATIVFEVNILWILLASTLVGLAQTIAKRKEQSNE